MYLCGAYEYRAGVEDGRVPLLPFPPPSKGLGVMVCIWPSMASRKRASWASVLCGCSLRLGKNGGHHCILYRVKVNVDCQHLLGDRPLGMSVEHIHTGLTEEENPPYMWVASCQDWCSQPNKEEKAAASQESVVKSSFCRRLQFGSEHTTGWLTAVYDLSSRVCDGLPQALARMYTMTPTLSSPDTHVCMELKHISLRKSLTM